MRFATIRLPDGRPSAAVLDGENVYPITGFTVLELIRRGLPDALAIGADAIAHSAPAATYELQAPLRPPTIRDFVTFEEHVEGVRTSVQGESGVPDAWYEAPHFYFTNPHTISGPGASIPVPHGCRALDFELEVAAVIGLAGSDLTVEAAGDHLFGYTILNDWSARDLQRREMEVGLGPAKGKDFANTLGPVLVTADELADRIDDEGFLALECTVAVNGVQVGRDVLSNMGWTFPAMIAYASRDSRIESGDLLGSGTVGNGGCLAERWGRRGQQDPPPLRPGDTVTLSVEGIGSLTNTVGEQKASVPVVPAARRRADRGALREKYCVTSDAPGVRS
ncbi:fumarylacetoacetate hydrolase family protein [Gordonia polyisoprenivorans]|uniref:fumarylacetoacetate hydrolase family protein n=1 Tax=Gordonia polyisoprenivorans TaxID=84595 RepID=UPI00197ADEAD|nr:fumarylacetoacetate hydrolase family protein [Gordonia polyisoprenivorans]UZF55888.1 fumarylacetoacetate hydrolase family protein [Gordonia polyisoprenivorans]